jgi:ornithine cyclodeaminase/alanine dehydrogenase-like protein (mu-crystallin family)
VQEQIRHPTHAQRKLFERKDFCAELPEQHAGNSGTPIRRERIFIRVIGLVNQDIAMANWIYRRALETSVGTRLRY